MSPPIWVIEEIVDIFMLLFPVKKVCEVVGPAANSWMLLCALGVMSLMNTFSAYLGRVTLPTKGLLLSIRATCRISAPVLGCSIYHSRRYLALEGVWFPRERMKVRSSVVRQSKWAGVSSSDMEATNEGEELVPRSILSLVQDTRKIESTKLMAIGVSDVLICVFVLVFFTISTRAAKCQYTCQKPMCRIISGLQFVNFPKLVLKFPISISKLEFIKKATRRWL